ncbi:MAG: ParB N-terminal domain-containing protein [Sandaracinaceae bacterium]|nr:ParB N-terminal domain-containing protein [Sandaracinaceae bacterium]
MATKKTGTKAEAAPKKKRASKKKAGEVAVLDASASELALSPSDPRLEAHAQAILQSGGAVLGAWREPVGGHPLLLASLPIDAIEPTPFQRDASPGHVRKLVRSIGKTKRFLDPIILMRENDGRWLTPNGNHRLCAMRELGARSIVALVVPERAVAYQILALNVEKAHGLRERATEVRRMIVDLAGWAPGSERDFELELDEPSLVTLGFAYELRPRLAGGAYGSVLKKVDAWIEGGLAAAVEERRRRAALVIALDDAVEIAVDKLKEKGLTSPYLKSFVVARVNPLRFIKGEPPSLDDLLATMTKRAAALDPGKITPADLARSGGAPAEHDEE